MHDAQPQDPKQCLKVVNAGMSFMRGYSKLAALAHGAGRPLFVYKPKIHYYHHILLWMHERGVAGKPAVNPLAWSCAMAEDFIGRISLISRRVSALSNEKRTIQRYLLAAYAAWQREDSKFPTEPPQSQV